MEYLDFIKSKIALSSKTGFEIDQSEINPLLSPHQKDVVQWNISGGCRADFLSFGLGKSFIQLETLRLIGKYHGGKQLIICPLGVRQEFKNDVFKLATGDAPNITDDQVFGLNEWKKSNQIVSEIKFIRRTEELGEDGLYITNYESVRDGRLDVNQFNGVSLDEASVLRSYGSKTFQTFLSLFQVVKYKYVATATPSPNRYKELIHYAGFLGVMDTGQALTRFFKRDSTQANNLNLMPHKAKEFWFWLSTWAVFIQFPSDLGYSDKGYDLPKSNIYYHRVDAVETERVDKRDGQRLIFGDASLSLSDASKEKRTSLDNRIDKMVEILNDNPDDNFILWHDQEIERHAIKKAVPGVVDIYGSLDLEKREKRVNDFSDGKFQYFSTKPTLSGSGCNFQRHCHKAIFLGIGFKFNDFIQSIHRIVRFLQEHGCDIHIIYASSEARILEVLKKKWVNHDKMVEKMTNLIKKHGLSHIGMAQELQRTIGIDRIEVKGENFMVANNDCVDECKRMDPNSVGMICTSIPFSNHYEYSPSYNDFGHTSDNDHFWKQMDYLTPELLRILEPGRIYACHTKDRILFGNVTGKGMPTVSPFHMETTFHCMKHGFDYIGMITVVTDVVRENNQTYRLGWSEQCKDGSKMGVGSPEYILIFRKPQTDRTKGYADVKISKTKEDYTRAQWQVDAHAFWRSSGNRLLNSDELASLPTDIFVKAFKEHSLENIYDYDHHVKIGEEIDAKGKLPSTFMSIAPESQHKEVWTDINRMITLNSKQSKRNQTQHICPMQTDLVKRLINRYSSKSDLIFDPFGGIMTVPYVALQMERRAMASELNSQYFLDGVKYLQSVERNKDMPTLFDCLKTA